MFSPLHTQSAEPFIKSEGWKTSTGMKQQQQGEMQPGDCAAQENSVRPEEKKLTATGYCVPFRFAFFVLKRIKR